jgi:hypothetical protein
MNRTEAVAQLQQVFSVLSRDLDEIVAYGRETPSPFAHRTLVRAHFALMEGLAYQLRQVTLATLDQTEHLTAMEIALLKEERYGLDGKGRPQARENFQAFLPNLLFTIQCYLKNHGATYQPNTGHHGWEAMRKFVEIRNRITHPKSTSSLELTETDLKFVVEAASWWKATMLEMFAACAEADSYWKAKLAQST